MFNRTITTLKYFLILTALIFVSITKSYSALILPDIFTDEFTANTDCSLIEKPLSQSIRVWICWVVQIRELHMVQLIK
jgi:hypothetical protein